VDVPAIHKEIYNNTRFDQISVMIVDYTIPNMSEAVLTQQLKGQGVQIILLIDAKDEALASTLFNQGVIQRFIRKDLSNFTHVLNITIESLQHEYFQKLSEIIFYSIAQKSINPNCPLPMFLTDPMFIQFFSDFLREYSITEYYLIEEKGSFLCLNEQGTPSWLLVKHQDSLKEKDWRYVLYPVNKLLGKDNYYCYLKTSPRDFEMQTDKIASYVEYRTR